MRVAFYTLGCKVNQYDTEAMLELFQNAGYTVVPFDEEADIYIINTCTVTSTSDSKSRQMIGRARRRNPAAVIGVTGCYSQRNPQEVLSIPGVDFVAGTGNRGAIVSLAEEFLHSRQQTNGVANLTPQYEELHVAAHEGKTRAYMKVQDGCRNFCTYCIIPYTRGPVRSRGLSSIEKEAAELVAAGYREIVVTGIHLGSYGRDNGLEPADAIEAVAHSGVARVRLGSLEPNMLTQAFLERMKKLQNLCPQFHVALQSGSDGVLKRMGRRYNTQEYRSVIQRVRSFFPEAAVTTDVMVGFPGETEREFQESLDFVQEIEFARIHVFSYSPRAGTPAANYPDQVEAAIKEKRNREMIRLGLELEEERLKRYVGRTLPVLFEQEHNGYFEGYTPDYSRVRVKQAKENEIADVMMEQCQGTCLLGRKVKPE